MTRPILLDTHVWVWLMLGDNRLGTANRRMLERAVPDGRIRVSIISAWEVAMLEAKGRLILASDCESWVREALAAPGIHLAELTPHIAVCSTRLPGIFHGDPADRVLIATARESEASLLTADEAILRYGKEGNVHTLRAES
ncbi:MAG: type II toxin-antitoxin system VapC family toxin [Lentisphaerae bacterium]|nr:type II toxin-antitoxin system VapC family toxin [Lentisphaerota bacterium]